MMQAVILAGGKGTRLSEETYIKPKPLVEVCGKPLIWHIMNHYSKFGVKDFIVLAGYKSDQIVQYFRNLSFNQSDILINTKSGSSEILKSENKDWNVTILNSGIETQTGGRLIFLENYVDEEFFLTYGDGLSNVSIKEVFDLHRLNNNFLTLTAVKPAARFGALRIDLNTILDFNEKPSDEGGWVNGGFMVVKKDILKYVNSSLTSLEIDVLPKLVKSEKVGAYKHEDFWHSIDTLRDLEKVNQLAETALGKKLLGI